MVLVLHYNYNNLKFVKVITHRGDPVKLKNIHLYICFHLSLSRTLMDSWHNLGLVGVDTENQLSEFSL